ncbi:hypothetical protein CGCF415_v010513 [Colletotrichum fructicola]|nr:hypothetical protein CGCFRS4_v013055 [Colletotrichum fructicola]KAF4899261.1 hypothetical protein CGCF415_v010513 [Colletotrichum fructicola]KAF4926663.1 hypothetical protein CGCF245_v013522 [Colletotrichum fructicola]
MAFALSSLESPSVSAALIWILGTAGIDWDASIIEDGNQKIGWTGSPYQSLVIGLFGMEITGMKLKPLMTLAQIFALLTPLQAMSLVAPPRRTNCRYHRLREPPFIRTDRLSFLHVASHTDRRRSPIPISTDRALLCRRSNLATENRDRDARRTVVKPHQLCERAICPLKPVPWPLPAHSSKRPRYPLHLYYLSQQITFFDVQAVPA